MLTHFSRGTQSTLVLKRQTKHKTNRHKHAMRFINLLIWMWAVDLTVRVTWETPDPEKYQKKPASRQCDAHVNTAPHTPLSFSGHGFVFLLFPFLFELRFFFFFSLDSCSVHLKHRQLLIPKTKKFTHCSGISILEAMRV